MQNLTELKGIVSPEIVKKIANQEITFDTLKTEYQSRGDNGIISLLTRTEVNSSKPVVTKDKRVLLKILNCIKMHAKN